MISLTLTLDIVGPIKVWCGISKIVLIYMQRCVRREQKTWNDYRVLTRFLLLILIVKLIPLTTKTTNNPKKRMVVAT